MKTVESDLDRLGIFKEMSYHTIQDPYDKPNKRSTRSAFKGKQMYCSGSKERSATADGYFGPFTRIYNGDSKIDLGRLARLQRIESAKKIRGKDWIPPSGSHSLHGLGSTLDTFSGPVPYMKPTVITKHIKLDHRRNFYTSPAKKGCGSYIDITIGKYPKYKSDAYDKRPKTNKSQSSTSDKVFYLNLHPVDYFDRNPYRHVTIRRSHPSKTQSNLPFRKLSSNHQAALNLQVDVKMVVSALFQVIHPKDQENLPRSNLLYRFLKYQVAQRHILLVQYWKLISGVV
uniref:Cilia-and flagella-associated protein 96 n=1 Tax=Trichobilharzia regenti TaxID=157069 RepID=A0AA85JW28_TRIRE|nr:unnamed protein product [Trichobilharzia regenti]